MKPLTPLEIEFWKINNIIEWNDRLLQSQSWEQEIQKARAAATLCEEKIRQAIELAREENHFGSGKNFKFSMQKKYTPDEIMQKLSEPQKCKWES